MKRVIAAETLARSVADDLFAAEAAIDAAMTQIAGLTCRLPAAHREAGFAATRGQPVYDSLVEALAAQTRARSAVVDVHNHLAELKQASVMRTVAVGGAPRRGPRERRNRSAALRWWPGRADSRPLSGGAGWRALKSSVWR